MSVERPVQPALSDLLANYLHRQTSAHADGLASADSAEVFPYDAGPVHPIDARLAWDETLTVARLFDAPLAPRSAKTPPQWPVLVGSHEPMVALACALGNFPQLVRHFHTFLPAQSLTQARPQVTQHPGQPLPALVEWARQAAQFPETLLAVGSLRLARHFELAQQLVSQHDGNVPATWRAAWDNEKAALAWHAGDAEGALTAWQQQPAAVPVLFNRGMAALFLDRPAEASASLTEALAGLPEDGAWHHLARLYLTLCRS